MTVILSVDTAKCTGHGRCYTSSPELLHDDEQGFVEVPGNELMVPPERLAEAQEAEQACPEGAIALRRLQSESRIGS